MILSVSRRTDIPAFYCDWFFNRLKENYVCVRNPISYHQVSRISLSPEVIDCIVFWTKDPSDIVDRLHLLKHYQYYFQVTINGYDRRIERFLPEKEAVLSSFMRLSGKIGKRRVIWRYDPIILGGDITIDFHVEKFREIAQRLEDYTDRCIISFVDPYKKTTRNAGNLSISMIASEQMRAIAERLMAIAREHGMRIETCSEEVALEDLGINHASCIDINLISELTGYAIHAKEDGQRSGCRCAACVDIGAYNTCKHGCIYCYATFSDSASKNNWSRHDVHSPLLIGELGSDDKVTDRKMISYRDTQISIFD